MSSRRGIFEDELNDFFFFFLGLDNRPLFIAVAVAAIAVLVLAIAKQLLKRIELNIRRRNVEAQIEKKK